MAAQWYRNIFPCMQLQVETIAKHKFIWVLGCYSNVQRPLPSEVKTDMVGPPDPTSNLRPIVFHITENETQLEKKFRLQREHVQQWNQDFWIRHNTSFYKERKDFINSRVTDEKKTLDANEMSVFYKEFLDKNWKTHLYYNLNWYKKNIGLVILAVRVKIEKSSGKIKSFMSLKNKN